MCSGAHADRVTEGNHAWSGLVRCMCGPHCHAGKTWHPWFISVAVFASRQQLAPQLADIEKGRKRAR